MAKLTKSQIKALASLRMPKYRTKESKTVKNFFNNHEMWKTCPNCGEETDLRKSKDCENCGEKLI